MQEYFACKATVYDALFNSVGIASGNTATFVPILMLCLLPLIYGYLSSSGNLPPKKEYEDEVRVFCAYMLLCVAVCVCVCA